MKKERDELDEKIKRAASQMERCEFTPCPDEETLVCYLEDRLEGRERDEIEGHLAVCSRCCDQVVAMNRVIHAEEEAAPVSTEAMQKAMGLVQESPFGSPSIPVNGESKLTTTIGAFSVKASAVWKNYGYSVVTASIIILLFLVIPYGHKTSFLGPEKSASPLELNMKVVGTKRPFPLARPRSDVYYALRPSTQPGAVIIEDGDVLRSHDGFQIYFGASRDAYVYVVLYRHHGKARLLFPSPEFRRTASFSAQVSGAHRL